MFADNPQQTAAMWHEKIDAVTAKLPALYADFSRRYVNWKMSTSSNTAADTNSELQRAFEHIKANLKQEQTDLATIDADIKSHTATLQHRLRGVDANIAAQQHQHNALMSATRPTQTAYDASTTRVDDYKATYWNQYRYNWFILFGLVACIVTIMRIGVFTITRPSMGYGLAAFAVYLLVVAVYLRRYGISHSYLFYFVMAPFLVFAVGLFVGRGAAAA